MSEVNSDNHSDFRENIRRGRRLILAAISVLIAVLLMWTIVVLRGQAEPVAESADLLQPRSQPAQTALGFDEESTIRGNSLFSSWIATPRAHYQIDARVLSTRQYYFDLYARFSPIDFALAWGSMFDSQVDAWVTWDQHNRWYYYRIPDGSPYSLAEIRDHSANVHIIPATDSLSVALLAVEEADVIRLEGLLVDVNIRLLGFEYETPTSLTRLDSGAGACEVMYVERLVVNGIEYR